ncbi:MULTISPECIES: TfuA-related McrA-glycine thioamidation protein [unclassified Methanoregula]|uniref:TfuA-related McrA-glycine thioamidation protein n=1 Tax=unclassified Methanoregula TaxID=2649730 RepID=UPI0009CDC479|nr:MULTISPECIES: TfuA-related McrA-glycine thioamidation protein [unclassified Methanoregula]OPX64855.1 MAG: TfuA-like protein [Methanoregula sp. PtaB.Bin085]OPY32907.1 MAG: TfuA-like protein [Methanoregula sp. PtaU1.Bin006]
MQRIIVFLGPSLEREAAERIVPAEYRPPAKRGDLVKAVQDGAAVIGLIDGVFHQESAVAHREILAAIKKGVTVVGSSSMGALRAAEMDTLGMTGIGEVYRMYKSGELVSDDEVALVFDPETGFALSEPLVNIRFTLKEAERQGILTPQDHAALLAAAQSVFYPQRTYAKIVAAAGDAIPPDSRERFLGWVKEHAVDQKRKDAVAALEYIRKTAVSFPG